MKLNSMEFEKIDLIINEFLEDKDINLSKDPKSDWLVFDWRQLSWFKDGLKYILEIYPKFDQNENITEWIFYGSVSYHMNEVRYYYSNVFANGSLEDISFKLPLIIDDAYNFIMNIRKQDIPLAYED
jgi:hypothetical protein